MYDKAYGVLYAFIDFFRYLLILYRYIGKIAQTFYLA